MSPFVQGLLHNEELSVADVVVTPTSLGDASTSIMEGMPGLGCFRMEVVQKDSFRCSNASVTAEFQETWADYEVMSS